MAVADGAARAPQKLFVKACSRGGPLARLVVCLCDVGTQAY